MKVVGGTKPWCGWLPAEQRLEAEDLAVDLGLRLIVQEELAVGDGRTQIVLQRVALA